MVGRELGARAQARRRRAARRATRADAAPLLEARGLGRRGQLAAARPARAARGESRRRRPACSAPAAPNSRGCCSASIAADSGELRRRRPAGRASTRRAHAIRHGLAMCPEERKTRRHRRRICRCARTSRWRCRRACGCWRRSVARASRRAGRALRARARHQGRRHSTRRSALLSGGNQQKALLARWLATEPRLLILDEPTRGIDVAAKQEIMDEILRLRATGMAVLFISSEIEEVVRVSRPHRRAARPPQGRRAAAGSSVDEDRMSTDMIAASRR